MYNARCSGGSNSPFRITVQKGQNISFSVIRLIESSAQSGGILLNEETHEHLNINLQNQYAQLGSLNSQAVTIDLERNLPRPAFVLGYQGK
jgi:hypothetical protein